MSCISRVACLCLLAVAGLPVCFAQQLQNSDSILGRWDLTVHGDDGDHPSWLEVRLRTEHQLMASFVGRVGSLRHASSVGFDDGRLDVRIPVQYEAPDGVVSIVGQLQGEQLRGVIRVGDERPLRWTGVRAPMLMRDDTPTWGSPVSLIGSDPLDGWRPRSADHDGCWAVREGVLSATPPCVDLVSEREFDDFRLHVEFRYPAGSNSGVYLRGRYEVQIQDDRGKALDPLRIGGIYGFIAPMTEAARPADEWQVYDITLVGRRVTVALNGKEIITDREIPGITGGALDSNEGLPGPLMLQGDHGPIEYRNIVIRPAQ